MSEDKAIHTLYERIGHLFYAKPYGELGRYLTYYAEDRLYLVFDTWYHGFFLAEARSPKDAIRKVNCDELAYLPKCPINGTPFDECGFCENFNCDTNKCDAKQTERSE